MAPHNDSCRDPLHVRLPARATALRVSPVSLYNQEQPAPEQNQRAERNLQRQTVKSGWVICESHAMDISNNIA